VTALLLALTLLAAPTGDGKHICYWKDRNQPKCVHGLYLTRTAPDLLITVNPNRPKDEPRVEVAR
jgi:hypothetical protein